jgi:threonine/homoserine/homoserine lactone efflux protein
MPEPSQYAIFVAACLALLLAPGPAVLYIVARGLHQGRGVAIASMVGIELAGLTHVALSVVGLTALLAASAEAYTIVRVAGGAYLIVLGIRTLLTRGGKSTFVTADASRTKALRQGYIVNLLNPKTALFFLAFLPQFADPARGPVAIQVLVLGLTWVGLACCTDAVYAVLAASVGARLRRSPRAIRAQELLSGGTYIVLGSAALAAGESPVRR